MTRAAVTGWLRRLLGTQGGPEGGSARPSPAPAALAPDAIVIDVRSPVEFDSGHLEGAISLPLDRIHLAIAAAVPDPKTPLVLYCMSGARSGRACAIAKQLGYESVRNGGGIGSLALTLNRAIARSAR